MIKFFNGMPIVINNTITKESEEEKYHISYNPSKRDYGVDTTALVITIGDNEREVLYILKVNHSEQYNNSESPMTQVTGFQRKILRIFTHVLMVSAGRFPFP